MAEHVLLISDAPIATVQLLERLLEHLARTSKLSFTSVTLDQLDGTDITSGTYPLIVRSCSPAAKRAVSAFQRAHAPFGFYIDDNFWLLDPESVLGKHYAARPTRRRLDEIVSSAQPVIASTKLLREWISKRTPHVAQLDSFFDFTLVPATLAVRPPRERLRAGFAASTYRGDDLAMVMSDLLAVLEERPNLEIEIIGAEASGPIDSHPRIRAFPYLNSYRHYLDFQQERAWDIGLAPLGSAGSNAYKTDNKYREYAALGIAGIYQDAPPYGDVREGVTGLLAGRTQSWGDALRRYCDEPGLIDAVRAAARADVEARLSLAAVAPRWQAFFDLAPSVGESEGSLDKVREALSRSTNPLARKLERLSLLWNFGLTHLAERGFWATALRTVHYLSRRSRHGRDGSGR